MLFQVLKISLIGHRKRILASLGDRLHEDPPQKPPRSITLRVSAATSILLSTLLKKYVAPSDDRSRGSGSTGYFSHCLPYLYRKQSLS